jgi:hypothetical protein
VKTIDRRRLIGAWDLVRWFVTDPDGCVTEPLGPDVRGLLVFTGDGWALITIAAAQRPRLPRHDPRAAPVEQRAAAFDSFINYCCRWRVVADSVELHVLLSQNPAMEGTVQVRRLQLRGRSLTTSTEEARAGGVRVHRLQWRSAIAGTRPGGARKRGSAPR